jgi:lipopolysaccharide export system protein LptA
MFPVKLILFFIFSASAYALPSDISQPLHILSDTSVYNYKTGMNTFEGHVKVQQGTSFITADKLITKSDSTRKVREAIAYGLLQPAHFWTTPAKNKPTIHARAGIIKYFPIEGNLDMHQNAYVTQGENIFKGEAVTYNMHQEIINVPASTTGQSILVYNPTEA